MGFDQNERKRLLKADKPKFSKKHPIAAIEKRVIDSEAFSDLAPSSVVVLLLLARNLDLGKNGHVFLSHEDAMRHGVDKKTLYRAFRDLSAHGFIFPTRKGGYGKCSTYALTWLPLSKDTRGLYVGNFQSCAWRDWNPSGQKKRGGKMSPSTGQKSPQGIETVDKNPPRVGDKNPPIEFNTHTSFEEYCKPGYLTHLARTAAPAGDKLEESAVLIPCGRTENVQIVPPRGRSQDVAVSGVQFVGIAAAGSASAPNEASGAPTPQNYVELEMA